MKIKLYKQWLKFIRYNFEKHPLLKQHNGIYILAKRIWNYKKIYPTSSNWVTTLKQEFLDYYM